MRREKMLREKIKRRVPLKKKGFTMIELIVVVAIIGVLAMILLPTMLGYTISSRITSVNHTASELRKAINRFLVEANVQQYGMFASPANTTEVQIEITNGSWTITVTNPSAFVTSGPARWSGTGTASGGTPTNPGNAEDVLGAKLSGQFTGVKTAYIGAYLEGGLCTALYYTDNTDESVTIQSFGSGGWAAADYAWDGKTAGINSEGYYVGTSPQLGLAEAGG